MGGALHFFVRVRTQGGAFALVFHDGVLCNLGVLMNMWAAEDLRVYVVFGWCVRS